MKNVIVKTNNVKVKYLKILYFSNYFDEINCANAIINKKTTFLSENVRHISVKILYKIGKNICNNLFHYNIEISFESLKGI